MWKRELICIGCPMGCNLTVTSDKDIPESSELVPSEFRDSLTGNINSKSKGWKSSGSFCKNSRRHSKRKNHGLHEKPERC